MKYLHFSHWPLLGLWLLLIGLQPTWADSQSWQATEQKGLLWKISKTGVVPSYLFGTIHSDDPRVIELPSLVEKALNKADTVALEIELNIGNMLRSATAMFFEGDDNLKSVLPAKDYKAIIARLEKHGIPAAAANRMKPWAIMVTLSMPELESGKFLDLILYERAVETGKKVYGLETIDEQLGVFENMPIEEQIILLHETIDLIEKEPDFFEKLHQLYLKRNLTTLLEFYQSYLQSHAHQEILEKFDIKILKLRNERMVQRMQPRLREGNAFVAVGTLHLPGEEGIIRLLEQEGYTVKAVY